MTCFRSVGRACGGAALLFLALVAFLIAAPLGAAAQEAASPSASAQMLADILKDDAKRAALIEQLETAGAAAGEAAPAAEAPSLGARIAGISQQAVEQGTETFSAFAASMAAIPAALSALTPAQWDGIIAALKDLALVIAVAFGVLYLLRIWLRRIYVAMGALTRGISMWRTLAIIAASVALDALGVVVAAAAGYLAAILFGAGEDGIGVRQALFLNAFVVIGLARVAIRAILAPSTAELRLVGVPDSGARIMATWFGLIASVLGYGQLLITPIVADQISRRAGEGASTVLALLAILIAMGLTLYGRRPVASWLLDGEERRGFRGFLAANWALPVLLYLLVLFVVVATRPGGVFWPLMLSTAKVAAAIAAGVTVSGAITRSIARGVSLPETVRERLPMLERRLNRFVPRALRLIRGLIVLIVLGFAVDAFGLFDMQAWLSGGVGGRLMSALVSAALIAFLAFAVWIALASWVDFRLSPARGAAATAREQTLLTLMKNAVTILIIVLSCMFILSEMGVNIAPLIASAGVFGLAIGFGAQKLVQDIITGVFIQFENAMNVGDVVTLNGITGVVEKLTIRSVSLRDVEGCFHIIPFSSVDMVSNYMREYGNFVCDMGIAYREDVSEAKAAMHDAFDELRGHDAYAAKILGPLEWFGLHALADSAVVLRARIKCAPGAQWGVGRAYNEIVKRIFDERNIEIPFPHQTIFFGVDKKGDAPPLHIAGTGGAAPAAATELIAPKSPRSDDMPDSDGDEDDGR
ncbi:MAG: mechanosensitive ion channel domain-containing protein [Pikeienuella sp.]